MLKRAPRAGVAQARLFAGKSRSCCPSLSSLGFAGSWSAGAMPRQHPRFFAGEHHSSPDLFQLPSPCTAQGGAPAPYRPQATQALPQERWGSSLLLARSQLFPWAHTGTFSRSPGHFCSLHAPCTVHWHSQTFCYCGASM